MTAARHYLDCNATAPLRPEARAAMLAALDTGGNASSVHTEGRAARAMMDHARRQVAKLVGVRSSAIHFTSGGTEANNWALSQSDRRAAAIATSHDSVLACSDVRSLSVDPKGLLDLSELDEVLGAGDIGVLSVMAVNNETGVIQPLSEISQACRQNGVALHVDAVQAPGKLDMSAIIDFADLISLSAHKLGGPAGCGAMIAVRGFEMLPMLRGGGQEARRRAGTENLVGIVGFGAAAEAVLATGGDECMELRRQRQRLEDEIAATCRDATVFGADADRVPNTTCVRMPGVSAETQVMALDLAGIAVSAGSACSSGKVTPSHVLMAMGNDESTAAEAIRVSTGWATSAADIDAFLAAWKALWQRKQAA